MNDICKQKCGESSYCMNNEPRVCHGCNIPCGDSTPQPPSSRPSDWPCCKVDTDCPDTGSFCQNGTCHGAEHGCNSKTDPKHTPRPHKTGGGNTSVRPGPAPVSCIKDADCTDGSQWRECRKGICVSKPIPDSAQPTIKAATIRPSETELTKLAVELGMTKMTDWKKMEYYSPPLVPWKTPHSGRPYRLTLWHEGIKGKPLLDKTELLAYMNDYIKFVQAKQFDRTFFQAGDPSMLDNYGYQKFPYADIDFLVENYLAKLPSYTTAGLLAIIDPRYIGYYDYKTVGGIWGNNPGYKNPIDVNKYPNYCQHPYRSCSANDKLCANTVPLPGKPSCVESNCPREKPYCDGSGCTKDSPCGIIKDYCPDEGCCLQYPVGCPNTLEQFFKYVGKLNETAKKRGVKPVTSIALDGEDFGMYGTDKYGLVQAWQAAKTYAKDINEIGYAHGPNTRARENWTNASYPEMYWIGELKNNSIDCVGCKEGQSRDGDVTCANCLNSLYQKNSKDLTVKNCNNPQATLDDFSKYLDAISPPDNPLSLPGTCPLLSIELAHIDKIGIGPEKTCIKNMFDNNDFCGTFDGFGNWDWSKFEEFMDIFAKKYNVKDIGVYEFQFVPPAWLDNKRDNQSSKSESYDAERFTYHSPTSGLIPKVRYSSSKKTCVGLLIGVLALSVVTLICVLYYMSRMKRR